VSWELSSWRLLRSSTKLNKLIYKYSVIATILCMKILATQVMNEMPSFNADRNVITNAKQKWKNAFKIVSQCLKITSCTKL
jgi:hypothetical protein